MEIFFRNKDPLLQGPFQVSANGELLDVSVEQILTSRKIPSVQDDSKYEHSNYRRIVQIPQHLLSFRNKKFLIAKVKELRGIRGVLYIRIQCDVAIVNVLTQSYHSLQKVVLNLQKFLDSWTKDTLQRRKQKPTAYGFVLTKLQLSEQNGSLLSLAEFASMPAGRNIWFRIPPSFFTRKHLLKAVHSNDCEHSNTLSAFKGFPNQVISFSKNYAKLTLKDVLAQLCFSQEHFDRKISARFGKFLISEKEKISCFASNLGLHFFDELPLLLKKIKGLEFIGVKHTTALYLSSNKTISIKPNPRELRPLVKSSGEKRKCASLAFLCSSNELDVKITFFAIPEEDEHRIPLDYAGAVQGWTTRYPNGFEGNLDQSDLSNLKFDWFLSEQIYGNKAELFETYSMHVSELKGVRVKTKLKFAWRDLHVNFAHIEEAFDPTFEVNHLARTRGFEISASSVDLKRRSDEETFNEGFPSELYLQFINNLIDLKQLIL